MGRPQKPDYMKVIQGTFRKDRAQGSATPAKGFPIAPPNMSEDAHAEWKRVMNLLKDSDHISKLDRAALVSYCEAWALWNKAKAELADDTLMIPTANGYQQANPLIGIATKAKEDMLKWARELGLTPASRKNLYALPDKQPASKLAKYIGGKGA